MRKKNKKMLLFVALLLIYITLKVLVIYTPNTKDDGLPDEVLQIMLKQG